jgi:hypothetical protein
MIIISQLKESFEEKFSPKEHFLLYLGEITFGSPKLFFWNCSEKDNL